MAKPEQFVYLEIPPEQQGAIEVAWKRCRQLGCMLPPFLLEAFKTLFISIYMQGCVDGYGACERQKGKSK